jgi:hypothetical protein
MPGSHYTRPYRRGDGTYVRGYTARNPGRKAAIAATVTATATVGFLTFTGSLPFEGAGTGAGAGASVDVNVDLNQAAAALAAIGFSSARVVQTSTDCAGSSTGSLQHFFTDYPCHKLVMASLTTRGQRTAARVVISWVTMPSRSLATIYRAKADAYGTGNPPEPAGGPRFNGLCYASGQSGSTVWTAQVQPISTPSPSIDREILSNVSPAKLSPGYVQQHCID